MDQICLSWVNDLAEKYSNNPEESSVDVNILILKVTSIIIGEPIPH